MFPFVFYWSLWKVIKFCTLEIPTRKIFWTHEIPMKNFFFGPTKYQQENILDIRNTYEKKFQTHECKMTRWNKTHENLTHWKFFNLFGWPIWRLNQITPLSFKYNSANSRDSALPLFYPLKRQIEARCKEFSPLKIRVVFRTTANI